MFKLSRKTREPIKEKKSITSCELMNAIECGKKIYSNLSSRQSILLYLATPPVRKAVDMIANLGSSLQPIIRDKKTQEPQEKHDALNLLENTYFGISSKEFIWQACVNYLVTANNYFLLTKGLSGKTFQLFNVSPSEITMSISNGRVQSYTRTIEYATGTQTTKSQTIYNRQELTEGGIFRILFVDEKGNELWHMKEYNPLYPLNGKSKISTLDDTINAFNKAGRHNRRLIENGCSPTGYLISKTEIPDEEYKKLQDNFRSEFTGENNAGKVQLLEGDIDYKEAHISPREMDWINGRKFDERLIYDLFGIPQAIVDNKASSFNNLSTSMFMLYEYTIFPLLDKIYGELTDFLMPNFKDDKLEIYYSKENIPSLDAVKTDSTLNKSKTGIYTIDELRIANGLEELPNDEGKVLLSSKPQAEELSDDVKGIYLDLMKKENYNLQVKELEKEGLL
jgi:HK97 family phage portal protein